MTNENQHTNIDTSQLAEMERLLAEATVHAHRVFAGGKLDDGNIEIRHLSRFEPDTLIHERSLTVVVTTEFRRRHTFMSLAAAHEFVKKHHAETMAISTDFADSQEAMTAMSKELTVLDKLACLSCRERLNADLNDEFDYVLTCSKGHIEIISCDVALKTYLATRPVAPSSADGVDAEEKPEEQ